MKRYLLIGCGRSRERRIDPEARSSSPFFGHNVRRHDFSDGALYTLDNDEAVEPDLLVNLDAQPDFFGSMRWFVRKCSGLAAGLAAEDVMDSCRFVRPGIFDEVHAYEVLEHLGRVGELSSFFGTFYPIWSVLKPGGFLCATVPSLASPWLWSDPGHRRVISAGTLGFLSRVYYPGPPSSDYRRMCPCDFDLIRHADDGANLKFILRAVKPLREVTP